MLAWHSDALTFWSSGAGAGCGVGSEGQPAVQGHSRTPQTPRRSWSWCRSRGWELPRLEGREVVFLSFEIELQIVCVCVCVCGCIADRIARVISTPTRTHTRTHAHTHARTQTYTHNTHTHTYTQMHGCKCTHLKHMDPPRFILFWCVTRVLSACCLAQRQMVLQRQTAGVASFQRPDHVGVECELMFWQHFPE